MDRYDIIIIIIIMMMMIIIVIIIIIILKRRNSRFFFFKSPHRTANCLQHVSSSGPGAIVCKSRAARRALIACNMSCATWYEGKVQLLSLTIAFI